MIPATVAEMRPSTVAQYGLPAGSAIPRRGFHCRPAAPRQTVTGPAAGISAATPGATRGIRDNTDTHIRYH